MFFTSCKHELERALEENVTLANRVEELSNEIAQLRLKHIDELNKAVNKDIETADFAMDYDACNAFAIERNAKDGKAVTIVGHFINEPVAFTDGQVQLKQVVKEWYMYCSQEQHNKLVADFKKKGKK